MASRGPPDPRHLSLPFGKICVVLKPLQNLDGLYTNCAGKKGSVNGGVVRVKKKNTISRGSASFGAYQKLSRARYKGLRALYGIPVKRDTSAVYAISKSDSSTQQKV